MLVDLVIGTSAMLLSH